MRGASVDDGTRRRRGFDPTTAAAGNGRQPPVNGHNGHVPADGWDTLALLRRRLAESLARVAEVPWTGSGELSPTISGELRRPPSGELTQPWQALPASAVPRPPRAPSPGAPVAASIALAQAVEVMAARLPSWNAAQISSAAHYLRGSSFPLAPGGSFRTDARGMLSMSHAIEDAVLARRLPCEFYAGFQRLSLLTHQISRYRALLGCVRYLCLYGLDDMPDSPALAQLRHPRTLRFAIQPRLDGGLAWYWFLAVDDPALRTVLLAHQTTGHIYSRELHPRTYEGFWTFHPPLVREIVGFLRQAGRAMYYA